MSMFQGREHLRAEAKKVAAMRKEGLMPPAGHQTQHLKRERLQRPNSPPFEFKSGQFKGEMRSPEEEQTEDSFQMPVLPEALRPAKEPSVNSSSADLLAPY